MSAAAVGTPNNIQRKNETLMSRLRSISPRPIRFGGVPTGVPDARFACANYVVPDQSESKWFNNDRNCYSQRPAFTFREVPNRFAWIRVPAMPQLNMALVKRVQFNERWSMELRGESFNFTNTPILRGPDTGFTSPTFGVLPIQQDNFARNIQLGARIRF